MPVTYQIDRSQGIIRTQCVGDVTLEEVLDHFQVLERDPNCPPRLDVLLDLSESTSVPASGQIMVVSNAIAELRSSVRFDVCAVVAATDVLFGMARVFEALANDHFLRVRVFRTFPEAEEWLDANREGHRPDHAG
jgi:hypothetical protein